MPEELIQICEREERMREGGIESGSGRKEKFWRHLGERRPNAPKAPRLRMGFRGHTNENKVVVNGYVFTVYQYVASETVGVYLKANHKRKQSVEMFDRRIKPYRELFEARLPKILYRPEDSHSYLGKSWRWSSLLWVGSTCDCKNWDEMADFLDERRQAYEEILYEGARKTSLEGS